jgi:hypothetical protein
MPFSYTLMLFGYMVRVGMIVARDLLMLFSHKDRSNSSKNRVSFGRGMAYTNPPTPRFFSGLDQPPPTE